MRIALTFNERRSDAEEEAELDSLETVHSIARLLASLGHVVTPVEVSGPFDAVIVELRRLAPDLVFNLAEGTHGTFREALLPAVCEQLGLPHTGSGASVLALCMDKALSKRVVAAARVRTPWARFVRSLGDLAGIASTHRSLMVKPNFEGSSKGITQASVIADPAQLREVVAAQLARYPSGLLVEDFVDGDDVAVGWVEGIGVLPAIAYAYPPTGPHRIYDLGLKQGPAEHIDLQVPAPLSAVTASALEVAARRAFEALGVTGYGRADFRITPEGSIYFLEMNPLPTLDPADRELYAAAAARGLTPRELMAAIIAAAGPTSSAQEREREPALRVPLRSPAA